MIPRTFSGVAYNSFGQVRLEALALSRRLLEPAVSASVGSGAIEVAIAPRTGTSFAARRRGLDIQDCRGAGVLGHARPARGGTGTMALIQGGHFVPIPFRDMIDPATGKIRVRRVAIASEA